MRKIDKIDTINRYRKRLKKYGKNIKALATGTKKRRLIRYQVISEIGIKSGDKILDVGCGFADYYKYLQDKGIQVSYTGIDISEDLINIAKKRYPKINLQVKDLEKNSFKKNSFDYVVSSQVFNHKLKSGQNISLSRSMMKLMFDISKKGVAIDFLSSYVDYKESRHFYYLPVSQFNCAKKISKRVILRHDYPLFEFCLYIYPNFKGWKNN